MRALLILAGLGSLVCFIMVVVKLFQEKEVLHGILGLICSLYTFIWGWIEAERLRLQQIMAVWSALIVLSIVLRMALRHSHW